MSTQVKNQLKDIMTQAWSFVKKNGMSMTEALRVAWLNFKVRKAMAHRIVKFWFLKVDGTTREAYGTLKSDIVPPTTENDHRKKNDSLQVYYDTEKAAWRCFKRANLLRMA
jgi:hypothetical protein